MRSRQITSTDREEAIREDSKNVCYRRLVAVYNRAIELKRGQYRQVIHE